MRLYQDKLLALKECTRHFSHTVHHGACLMRCVYAGRILHISGYRDWRFVCEEQGRVEWLRSCAAIIERQHVHMAGKRENGLGVD